MQHGKIIIQETQRVILMQYVENCIIFHCQTMNVFITLNVFLFFHVLTFLTLKIFSQHFNIRGWPIGSPYTGK